MDKRSKEVIGGLAGSIATIGGGVAGMELTHNLSNVIYKALKPNAEQTWINATAPGNNYGFYNLKECIPSVSQVGTCILGMGVLMVAGSYLLRKCWKAIAGTTAAETLEID